MGDYRNAVTVPIGERASRRRGRVFGPRSPGPDWEPVTHLEFRRSYLRSNGGRMLLLLPLTYALGIPTTFALVPMLLAPFSTVLGRELFNSAVLWSVVGLPGIAWLAVVATTLRNHRLLTTIVDEAEDDSGGWADGPGPPVDEER